MNILDFIVTVVLVSASGALAPGPLLFANLSEGVKHGAKSGLIFSVAHTLVEFILVMLLGLGLLTFTGEPTVKFVIGVAGGSVLVAFGVIQILGSLRSEPQGHQTKDELAYHNIFILGLVFTGLNPFFIIWWLTAGAQLVILSLEFASLAGVFLMYLCHVWMDYVWLTAMAHSAKIGLNIVGFKWYRLVMTMFSAVLIYFGLTFLIDSINL